MWSRAIASLELMLACWFREMSRFSVLLVSVIRIVSLAALLGFVNLQGLLQLGAGLDAADAKTALMEASSKGDIEMVKLLHEAKADLNVCGRFGTLLHRAVGNEHTEVLKVTLKKRIRICFCADLMR